MQRSCRALSVVCKASATRNCLLLALIPATVAFAQTGRRVTETEGVSFERLVDFLEQPNRDTVSDALAIKLIERFGLSFRPTAEEMARLRTAASAALLVKTIEAARLPPAPLRDASLAIECAPVDCQIWVDDRAIGQTLGGESPWLSVHPGKIGIRVASSNYRTPQARIELQLESGERKRIAFPFQPTQEFLLELGARYSREMLAALGGNPGKDFAVRAAGSLYLRDDNVGRTVAWSMIAQIGVDGLSFVEVSRLNQKATFERVEAGAWKQSAGRPAPQIAKAIALLEKAVLCGSPNSLQSGESILAAEEPSGPVRRFRSTGSGGAYTISLDPLSRPSEIVQEVQGAAQPTKYFYSGYSEMDGRFWPNLIEAADPGERVSITARFSTVERAPVQVNPPSRPAR